MAFAKGRAFVILNRMAESGNSEAKKILGNLNSMSQEDLDSKLSTLFGKGGTSKEGDTAPKDEKGGKAPEGKEEAPKGEKGAIEGDAAVKQPKDRNEKVEKEKKDMENEAKYLVSKYNDDYVVALKKLKERYSTSRDRVKAINELLKEVDNKETPKEGKVVANKDFDPNKEGVQSIFGTEEENAKSKDKQVFNTMEEVDKPKEMTSAKEGIKPLESDTPKASNEDYFKLDDEFETMVNYDGTNSMEVVSQLKEKYKGDATKQQALNKLEGKEKFKAATKEYLEKNSGTSPLWAKSGMTGNQKLWDAERVRDAMYDFINDEPTIEAALAEAKSVFEGSKESEEFINYLEQKLLGNKEQGVAPTQNTDAFGTSKEMGGGIGGGQKDLLGKKADMADPNREDLRKEMETEIEDYLTQTGQDEEAIGEAIQELKQKYMGDTQRYAALDRLDIERTGYESTPEGGTKAVEKLRAEAAEKAKGSASNPMTSATEGIKPVEGGTPTEQWAGAAKPEVKSKVTKDKEYYGELQKNMNQMLNYGRDEEIKERVSKEVEDTIEELNLVETPEGAEFEGQIDFLTRIYMPNISLAYYRKLQEISPNERQNYTLKDYLKSATATDVSTKVKQASGGRTNPQRDDVTYMRLLLDKIKKELKAKKG
jgi:hypothetical protein